MIISDFCEDDKKINASTAVTLIDPRNFFYFISDGPEVDVSGAPVKVLSLAHCKYNNRERHMDHPPPHTIKPSPSGGRIPDQDDVSEDALQVCEEEDSASESSNENIGVDLDEGSSCNDSEGSNSALSVDLELSLWTVPVLQCLIESFKTKARGAGVTAQDVRSTNKRISVKQVCCVYGIYFVFLPYRSVVLLFRS